MSFNQLLTPHLSRIPTLPFSNFAHHILHATDNFSTCFTEEQRHHQLPAVALMKLPVSPSLISFFPSVNLEFLPLHKSHFPCRVLCYSLLHLLNFELLACRILKTLCVVFTNCVALSKCAIIIYKLFIIILVLLHSNTLHKFYLLRLKIC